MGPVAMDPAVRFWRAVEKTAYCWPWKLAKPRGYGMFKVRRDESVRAHRMAWELTNGPIPEGMLVCHRCDNPACCNPGHLFLGTHQDNMDDRNSKNRQARGAAVVGERPRGDTHWKRLHPEWIRRGSAHPGALTNETAVRDIRAAHACGASIADLARVYGLQWKTTAAIVHRKTWKHV